MDDAEIAEQVQRIVLRRVETDDLVLPAMPAVVSRCLGLLADPARSLKEVATAIETDAIVAAQIVRLANVAARAPVAPVRSITECVTRLGAAELQLFLVETAARRLFESTDRHISELCRGLWGHSLAVAILSRDLLRHSRVGRPDDGYLAGLLHDIGKPVMAAMMLDAERRLRGSRTQGWLAPAAWLRLIARGHRPIGVALAAKWGLPLPVQLSIRSCDEYDQHQPHSLANAVRLANAIAKREGLYVGAMDEDQVEALVFVGRAFFGLDDQGLDYLTTYLKERVNERLA
jgi:putative nucleotidyltransferase with HDIG domain